MKRVIVSGADGFVGSNTTKFLLQKNLEVVALDMLENPRRLPPREGLTYIAIDVSKEDELVSVLRDYNCDTWFHFAWQGVAREKRSGYEVTLKNAVTTVQCMKAANKIGCKRFVAAGSISEREAAAAIFSQGNKLDSAVFYGIGKLLAHALCKVEACEIGIEYVAGVIANIYGEAGADHQFINRMVRSLLLGEKIPCTKGEQNFDFIHIEDVANAFYLIGEKGRPGYEYLIGSGEAKPLREFLFKIQEICGVEDSFLFGEIPFRGGKVAKECFDISQLQKDTGFVPAVSFEAGVRRIIKWMQEENKK